MIKSRYVLATRYFRGCNKAPDQHTARRLPSTGHLAVLTFAVMLVGLPLVRPTKTIEMHFGGAMNNQRAVIQTLLDYYAAFSSLEVGAVLPYFHEPSMLIGPQVALAAPTRDALTPAITTAIESLRARGFGRSELSVRRVESLSANATLVTGVALRYKVDGQELERVGVTYVLYNAASQWKIAVLIVHDPNEGAPSE